MKIYVASHCRWAACHVASELRKAGHKIISHWHDVEFLPTHEHTESQRRTIAAVDIADVAESDALVLIAGPDKYSGGKFVEAGIAIGRGKPVYVLGRRENMLLWSDKVTQFNEIDDIVREVSP